MPIEATEIQALDLCPRQWYITYRMNLVPLTEGRETVFGTAVHAALRSYFAEGRDPAESFVEEVSRIERPTEDEEWEPLVEIGEKLMKAYPAFWEQSPYASYKVRHTEVAYDLPISGEIMGETVEETITGRMDLVLEAPNGSILIADHKTCGQRFPDARMLAMNKQAGIYKLAATQLFAEPVAGFLFDHIRKQDPDTVRTLPVFRHTILPINGVEAASFHRDALWAVWWRKRLETLTLEETPTNVGYHCTTMCRFYEPCMTIRHVGGEAAEGLLSVSFKERGAARPGVARA